MDSSDLGVLDSAFVVPATGMTRQLPKGEVPSQAVPVGASLNRAGEGTGGVIARMLQGLRMQDEVFTRRHPEYGLAVDWLSVSGGGVRR